MPLARKKPNPHDPCSKPLISPRDLVGHASMASAAPAGHSAPIPMPKIERKAARKRKFGANPATKLQSEYHRIDIIKGVLRPMRSHSHPDATPPIRRSQSVTETTNATAVRGTSNSRAMGTMIRRKIVKSNKFNIQPSQPAIHAIH